MRKIHTVEQGDTLWHIAKQNRISLEDIYRLNPNIDSLIHPGDKINIEPERITHNVNIRAEREREARFNLDNISAIQNAQHDRNYVIVDKQNRTITVFDKNNQPIYQTNKFSTGLSGDDYNTITYVDKSGKIKDKQGNNSTPAGITIISGVGEYHGFPSFTRARVNQDGSMEDIASSFHYGNVNTDRKASNGCVRIEGKTLKDMSKFIGAGTPVYTLPEKENSRFSLKGGALNFTADNPYGNDKGNKKFWDDYNINIDKSYRPLLLTHKRTGNEEYDSNVKTFSRSLVNNKKNVQQMFNLSSDEYNRLAELALGLAEQETKFGTSTSYNAKKAARSTFGDYIIDNIINPIGRASRQVLQGQTPHNLATASSRGATQIKISGDNKGMQEIYKTLGITDENIDTLDKSALATIARLAYMYNTEIKGRKFTGENNIAVSPYDALLYKWNGRNVQLDKHLATPDKNVYIANVKKYGNRFGMFEQRTDEIVNSNNGYNKNRKSLEEI